MKQFSYISLSLLLFTACVKDKPNSPVQPQVQLSAAKKVYIVNEGPFPTGNGSVSLYDPQTGDVIENFYKTQNTAELGNVAQSMSFINGSYYIVVNNAQKIVVCDEQLKKTGEIAGLTSPRYMLAVTNKKAYVSDLYANAISVIDMASRSKVAEIPCHGKTERMVLIYNKVFVTNSDKDYIYIINAINDTKTDSVPVGKGAAAIIIDKNDKVWVLASGNSSGTGRLSRINAISHQVEQSFTFGANELPGTLCLNKTKDTLYFLNNDIFRMGISDNALPSAVFVAKGSRNFYGLGVNPNDYTIYAADALDYVQKSNVYIFDANGTQKNVFKAGIISNGFYFE
jgi:YVTN family beta-propeller protein